MKLLKEVVQIVNSTVQTFLTELTSHATLQLSDLPFRAGYMLIFGLVAITSLAKNTGDKVERAIEEKDADL